jgi:REP element-mobilizing transposase RayT
VKLLAFHITWGTYGTRLHGDSRKTVDRQHNQYGEPVVGFDEHRWQKEIGLLKFPPVIFEPAQMVLVESLLPEICERGGWKHIAGAAGPDHVHEILASPNDPKTIRRLLKRWLGQTMCERLGDLSPGATWWAECGSIRWIFAEDGTYFDTAVGYVNRQRATPE